MRLEFHGEPIDLRPMTEDDVAFVYSTWLQSYRRRFVDLTRRVYWKQQRERVDRIVSATRIACQPGAERAIHGYVCGGPGLLHYVYVPFELRGRGLARDMTRAVCGEGAVTLTHFWPWERMPSGWSLRPDIPWLGKRRLEEA